MRTTGVQEQKVKAFESNFISGAARAEQVSTQNPSACAVRRDCQSRRAFYLARARPPLFLSFIFQRVGAHPLLQGASISALDSRQRKHKKETSTKAETETGGVRPPKTVVA